MPILGVAPLPIDGPGSVVGSDRPRFTAYAADGTEWHLGDATDDGDSWIVLMPGMTGLEHPPVTLYSSGTPQLAGAQFGGYHVEPRSVFIPIAVIAGSYSAATDLRRKLVAAFSVLTGAGVVTLEAAQPDGTRRSLQVRFSGEGMAGDESVDQAGLTWATYGLVGICYDPFWYGEQINPAPWSNPAPRLAYPLPPEIWRLSDSNILGEVVLSNPGDVPAFPRWQLQGPATSITLSSGSSTAITVNHAQGSGETLIIDTDPTKRLVVSGFGDNLWGAVPDGYKLWPLPPGNSVADFIVPGATSETLLIVSYTPRYYRW